MRKKLIRWTTATTMALNSLISISQAQAQTTVARPSQFVMFAYDGSYRNEVWQDIRDFSKTQKEVLDEDVKFTFFISPVYLLYADNKLTYSPPGYRLGRDSQNNIIKIRNKGSAIGWGDSPEDISKRIEHMNEATEEGHEIGSHANGHFDGGYKECNMDFFSKKCSRKSDGSIDWKWDLRWTKDDWKSEFTQFNYILDNVFSLNKIAPSEKYPEGLNFRDKIIGFRAPVLGVSDGLWPTLQEFGFKYDTSKVNTTNYWPTKSAYGTWDFPLAEIPEPGTARKWISMDYNHCVRQSASLLQEDPSLLKMTITDPVTGVTKKANAADCLTHIKPEQKAKVKKQILDLYMSYFNSNYYGNRAPIHIGHHFSKWMSGAYYEAFFDFAKAVCNKPEVKCGTYTELMQFMESKNPTEIEAYRKGLFTKVPMPKAARPNRVYDLNVSVVDDGANLKTVVSGADKVIPQFKSQIVVGDKVFTAGSVPKTVVRALGEQGSDLKIRAKIIDRMGKEIQTSTQILNDVGTSTETLQTENVEGRWSQGHLPEAHLNDFNETLGH